MCVVSVSVYSMSIPFAAALYVICVRVSSVYVCVRSICYTNVVVYLFFFLPIHANWIIHGKRLFQPIRVMFYFCEWIVALLLHACKWKGQTADGKCTLMYISKSIYIQCNILTYIPTYIADTTWAYTRTSTPSQPKWNAMENVYL